MSTWEDFTTNTLIELYMAVNVVVDPSVMKMSRNKVDT
jgi:hypothetical protein